MASVLAPHTQQLQKMLNKASPKILPKPSVHWPHWRKQLHCQRRDKGIDSMFIAPPTEPEKDCPENNRVLKKQATDETTLPMECDVLSCSGIGTWPSAVSGRQHSRKPRSGRRAKAKLHTENFERCGCMAIAERKFELGAASKGSWNSIGCDHRNT